MNNQKKGFLGRLFRSSKSTAQAEASAPAPVPASDSPAPPSSPASETKTHEMPPPFQEAGHVWAEFTDPLYILPDENQANGCCRLFTMHMEEIKDSPSLPQEPKTEAAVEGTHQDEAADISEGSPAGGLPVAEDRDASIHLKLSDDCMAAWLYILPPSGNGSGVTPAMVQSALKEKKVCFGILDDKLRQIQEDPPYNQPILIARGLPAKNGVDTVIIDHFKRVITQEFIEDARGNIDFKQLNNIQQVKAGDVICDIIPAVPGEQGKNVLGGTVSYKIAGKDARIPKGPGTSLSEDKTHLLADTDGHLLYKGDVFRIEPILKITSDVDTTTGNLDFNGDVSINGDVRNGFSVKATGSIFIHGSVEGAILEAGKNIEISSGVTGNGRAVITAGGSVKCKYLEHCTVSALGDIVAESLVLCQVQSNHTVQISSGIGAIIGGQIVAANAIIAKSIGSKARHTTTLILGTPFKAVEEKTKAEQELQQLHKNLSELEKNITYLQTGRNPGKMHLIDQLISARDTLSLRKEEVTEQLETLNASKFNLKECRIKCTRLFPVTNLKIGTADLKVQDEYSCCNIYRNDDGEIVIGSD